MFVQRFGRFAAVVGLCFWAMGCAGNAERPPLGRVSGKVTHNGKPVTSGSVVFSPVGGTQSGAARIATGQIESDGSYTLTTYDTGDGAVLGQHTVTVESRGTGEDIKNLNVKPGGAIAYKLPKSTVPDKYLKTDRSPLKHTVEAGKNTIDIDLKD
jgi:hypothetical protein